MVVVAHNMRDKMKHFMEFTVLNLAKKNMFYETSSIEKTFKCNWRRNFSSTNVKVKSEEK